MIRLSKPEEFKEILLIINDGAEAYRGVIPNDCWHEPYMSADQLAAEIDDGVVFWGCEQGGRLLAVMGIQDKGEVTLIRHAYVRTDAQRGGLGGQLIRHLLELSEKPFLVGTWADADWAVRFYEKQGFRMVSHAEKERLLRRFWTISERQVETSVVLGGPRWFEQNPD